MKKLNVALVGALIVFSPILTQADTAEDEWEAAMNRVTQKAATANKANNLAKAAKKKPVLTQEPVLNLETTKGIRRESVKKARSFPLHDVVGKGDLKSIRNFIHSQSKKINFDEKNNEQKSALHIVAQKGRADIGQALIKQGASPDAQDAAGATPLHIAVQANNTSMISSLIELGANVNAQDDEGLTPLDYAANKDFLNAAQILITQPTIDVSIADNSGKTALDYALANSSPSLVKLFVDNGKITPLSGGDDAPYIEAHGLITSKLSMTKDAKMALGFIAGGANMNLGARLGRNAPVDQLSALRTLQGKTPLHWAAQSGSVATVKALIAAGANVNSWTEGQQTPLDLVKNNKDANSIKIAKMLTDAEGKTFEGLFGKK